MSKIKIPDFPNLRYSLDFGLIPSLVFSEDFKDFLFALINSKGEVLADIFNDAYKKYAKENGIDFTDEIFTVDDFTVINGKSQNNKAMTIVCLPNDTCDGIICHNYVFVFDIETFDNVRFFTIEKNSNAAIDIMEILSANEEISFNDAIDVVPVAFLCEVFPDNHLNYGTADKSLSENVKLIQRILANY